MPFKSRKNESIESSSDSSSDDSDEQVEPDKSDVTEETYIENESRYRVYDEFIHNVVFNVNNNEKIYTHMYFLVQYSTKFEMFLDDNKEQIKNEKLLDFDIPNVSSDELIMFFDVLMHHSQITQNAYFKMMFLCEYFQIKNQIKVCDFNEFVMNFDFAIQIINDRYAINNKSMREKIIEWSDGIDSNELERFIEKIMDVETDLSWLFDRYIVSLFSYGNHVTKNIYLNLFNKRYSKSTNYQELVNIFSGDHYGNNYSREFVGSVFVLCNKLKIPFDVIANITNAIIDNYGITFDV